MSPSNMSCIRCSQSHSTPNAFIVTCSECRKAWHHRMQGFVAACFLILIFMFLQAVTFLPSLMMSCSRESMRRMQTMSTMVWVDGSAASALAVSNQFPNHLHLWLSPLWQTSLLLNSRLSQDLRLNRQTWLCRRNLWLPQSLNINKQRRACPRCDLP